MKKASDEFERCASAREFIWNNSPRYSFAISDPNRRR